MNSTEVVLDEIREYYIVCSFTAVFFLIAMAISLTILILVYKTKPRLHTVRHLLICNTAVASILFCIVQTNNYMFLLFIPQGTSDMSCRWRGYFAYLTLCGVLYSFLIQAISRLFISLFSRQYRWLTTFRVHYLLIGIQWFVAIVLPLPAIVTMDIISRPYALCFVPLRRMIHVAYTYIAYYTIPAILICILYIFIYHRVKQMSNRAEIIVRSVNSNKRDLELLRNIVILLSVYLMGGVPTLLFLFSGLRILYLMGIVSIAFGVATEKVFTVLLDRELRQVVRQLRSKGTRIIPIDNSMTTGNYQINTVQTQRIFVQSTSKK